MGHFIFNLIVTGVAVAAWRHYGGEWLAFCLGSTVGILWCSTVDAILDAVRGRT